MKIDELRYSPKQDELLLVCTFERGFFVGNVGGHSGEYNVAIGNPVPW